MRSSLVFSLGLLFSLACKPSPPDVVIETGVKGESTSENAGATDSVDADNTNLESAAPDDFVTDGPEFGIKCEPIPLPADENGQKRVQLGCRAGGGPKGEMALTNAAYSWEFQRANPPHITVIYPTVYNTNRYHYTVVVRGSSDAILYQYLAMTRVSLRVARAVAGARLFGYLSILGGSKEAGFLPHNFKVYETSGAISSSYSVNAVEKNLKTINRSYFGAEGCYVACYSRDAADSTYAISDGIYVKGQVRVRGGYDEQNICRPEGYESADISAVQKFSDVCMNYLNSCKVSLDCWAGGDTGGWF